MKLSLLETLMDTLYATCIPVITDCTYNIRRVRPPADEEVS